jgi:hypothetical protein
VWPYYSGEEIELVNVFNQRVEAHRGHLKKWWDSLPNSSCPVCGGA